MANNNHLRFEELTGNQVRFFIKRVLPIEFEKIVGLRDVAEVGLFGVKLDKVDEYISRYNTLVRQNDVRGLYELICSIDGKTFIQ